MLEVGKLHLRIENSKTLFIKAKQQLPLPSSIGKLLPAETCENCPGAIILDVTVDVGSNCPSMENPPEAIENVLAVGNC